MLSGCAIAPTPLTPDEIRTRLHSDRAKLDAAQAPVYEPISLAEAMARALKFNLDHRLKIMEVALAQGESELNRWDLLPKMTGNAGYTSRNNEGGSSSKSLLTGNQSLESSASSNRSFETADLTMAWNLLDFGITYLRNKQQADRVSVLEEKRRKVIHTVIQDVRNAYWRAHTAQQLLPRLEDLNTQVQSALSQSSKAQERGLIPPTQALEFRITLLETLRQIGTLKRDLVQAKTELAALMNLAPGAGYQLPMIPVDKMTIPELSVPMSDLQHLALFNRPELREEDYQERISVSETTKSMLRMLPGLEITGTAQHSGNTFMYNQNWLEGGFKLSWNLLNLANGPEAIDLAEARTEMVRQQRLALSMAMLAQVNVAWLRFQQTREDFQLANQLAELSTQLHAQTETARNVQAGNGLEAIRTASRALFTELQRGSAYAEMQNAVGRLFVSLGLDLLPEATTGDDLKTLSREIESALSKFEGQSLKDHPAFKIMKQEQAAVPLSIKPEENSPDDQSKPATTSPVSMIPQGDDGPSSSMQHSPFNIQVNTPDMTRENLAWARQLPISNQE